MAEKEENESVILSGQSESKDPIKYCYAMGFFGSVPFGNIPQNDTFMLVHYLDIKILSSIVLQLNAA